MVNKILTVCQRGNCRSVALAYIFKDRRKQKDAIAIGADTTTEETWNMLGNWADKIYVVAEEKIKDRVPNKFKDKIIWLDIGRDIWRSAANRDLLTILENKLKEYENNNSDGEG